MHVSLCPGSYLQLGNILDGVISIGNPVDSANDIVLLQRIHVGDHIILIQIGIELPDELDAIVGGIVSHAGLGLL